MTKAKKTKRVVPIVEQLYVNKSAGEEQYKFKPFFQNYLNSIEHIVAFGMPDKSGTETKTIGFMVVEGFDVFAFFEGLVKIVPTAQHDHFVFVNCLGVYKDSVKK